MRIYIEICGLELAKLAETSIKTALELDVRMMISEYADDGKIGMTDDYKVDVIIANGDLIV